MSEHKHTNLLINETSPYLLQHAHNPVNWHPWGEEAFAEAWAEGHTMTLEQAIAYGLEDDAMPC